MTFNPDYIPLVDIIQGHFHKSFELLIKIGLWLVVNSECCLWSTGWGLPYCAATGCKLAKLGWNKIEHRNSFFQYFFYFYPISRIHWTLKMPYVFMHLEVYMKTWFLYCFIKKSIHTILYHFNIICKMWTILFRPHCVKMFLITTANGSTELTHTSHISCWCTWNRSKWEQRSQDNQW